MPFFAGGASNYKNYVEDMSADRVFGTGLEIGAMTNALGRPVRVWQTNMNVSCGSHITYGRGIKAAVASLLSTSTRPRVPVCIDNASLTPSRLPYDLV